MNTLQNDATIAGLDSDYEAAIDSVRGAIERFRGGTPEERTELARELDQLHAMAEKLAAGKVEIAVFGEISTGKSALINALVGEAVAEVSVRGGWTKDVWNVGWQGAGYCVPGLDNSQVVLIDTPGLPIRTSTKWNTRPSWSWRRAISRFCWC
jgi:ribosome biogenesis GTPase A